MFGYQIFFQEQDTIQMSTIISASQNTGADLVVYGKIFTSENGKILEAFAVKDGKYVYAGDRKGA